MLLPLFPLPNVVLFPGVPLPLHIFEPRYRAMVAGALDGDRRIGMVLLQPGFETDYDGRPPIYAIGCTGVIANVAKLEDGRYNLVLHGLERMRVASEDHERPYRRAIVQALPDPALDDDDQLAVRLVRSRLAEMIGSDDSSSQLASMPDAEFVHTLAQGLDFDPLEKQALLERPNLRLRAESLADLLEMRKLQDAMPPVSTLPQ